MCEVEVDTICCLLYAEDAYGSRGVAMLHTRMVYLFVSLITT